MTNLHTKFDFQPLNPFKKLSHNKDKNKCCPYYATQIISVPSLR